MSKLITSSNLYAYHTELAEHIKLLQRGITYSLNNIVNYDGKTLKCTTAGTTATTKPNVSALDVGDTYTDGTCVWTVVDLDKRGINYWETSTTYALNDQVVYNDKIYKCSTAHTSTSTFDDTKWTEISVSSSGGGLDYWATSTSYSVDDIVVYNNQIWRCTTAHTSSSTFDSTKFTEISASGAGGISVWASNTQYTVNDVVIDSNLIWQCATAHTSTSTFDESKWEEISGGGIFAWKSNKNYKVGIMVVYKYCIYMCKVAHTSTSEFDYSKWIIIGGGNGDFGDYVGHITWQMSLQSNYLKLDGTPLANASNDYNDLLKFAQDNSLITADTTDKSLFKYDSNNDVLTLPDYIGLCLQGGNTVEEKEAGLPNIKGSFGSAAPRTMYSGNNPTGALSIIENGSTYAYGGSAGPMITTFDASLSNPIYSDSVNTVQPPAITLIPQIRYKYSGITYSTEEQRIGTWIDGKPLYQKTIAYTSTFYNGWTTVYTFDTDITPVDIKATVHNLNLDAVIPLGSISNDTDIMCNYGLVSRNLLLYVKRGSDAWNNAYITVQYIKN